MIFTENGTTQSSQLLETLFRNSYLVLKSNLDLSFKGSEPAGMGYILEPQNS